MAEAHGEPAWFFFDAAEQALVRRALTAIGGSHPKQRVELEGMIARLGTLAALIRDAPSMSSSWDAGARRTFTAESLIEQLCNVHEYDLDLHIPTKAVIGQAYLVAKINLLKALGYALEAASAPRELSEQMEREVAQSIYTKLAEELFVAIVTDAEAPRRVKSGAARFLSRIWEQRLLIEIDDFAPLLESAWAARSKLLPVLGTMLGTHEVFRLFQEAHDKRFLDYFGDEDVEEEPLLAFEEFLFGPSHEDIARIRASMIEEGRGCISLDEARAVLGHAATSTSHDSGAAALYTSYKKRRLNAAHRALTGAPGPKKTAEEYVMITFLHAGASPSTFAMKAVRPP
ncbi:hypothetical protein BH11MYX4_BH11MYX4_45220 [soil metagenome]